MIGSDNAYSRVVSLLKIILPLLALAILSTMFLISRTIDPSRSIPFAEVDVEELAKEQRIGGPNFSGMTDDGSAISLSAERALPDLDNPGAISAIKLRADIETRSGVQIEISASHGRVDTTNNIASLSTDVVLTTSTGYRIETKGINARLDTTNVTSDGPVKATSPIGSIDAGSMTLTQTAGTSNNNGYLLVFNDGVKLIYEPAR